MDKEKLLQKKIAKNPKISDTPALLFSYALKSSQEAQWLDDSLRRDPFKTFVTVLELAERGELISQNQIGFWFAHGVIVRKNWAVAIRWYKKAIANGSGLSLSNLAVHFLGGLGLSPDAKYGIHLLENGMEMNDGKAFFWRGQCYRLGIGQKKDMYEAQRYLEIANELGYSEALYYLKNKKKNEKKNKK